MARLEAEAHKLAGEAFNLGSPKQLGDILFGKFSLPGGRRTKTGAWSTDADILEELAALGHDLPARVLEWRQVSKLKSTYTDALPTYINPVTGTRAHVLCARIHDDGAPVLERAQSPEHPDPHRGRPAHPPRLHRAGRPLPRLRRLFADRAASARQRRRRAGIEPGLRRRARHSRDDGVRDVQRADQGHAGRDPPPRQGDQFRHHLRHLRVRSRQPARHPARRSRLLHQEIFRALPRHPRLHGLDQGVRARARLCRDHLRPPHAHQGRPRDERGRARLWRASGDQRAAPGLGRRHHPPRDGALAARARRARSRRAIAAPGARRAGAGSEGRSRGRRSARSRAR